MGLHNQNLKRRSKNMGRWNSLSIKKFTHFPFVKKSHFHVLGFITNDKLMGCLFLVLHVLRLPWWFAINVYTLYVMWYVYLLFWRELLNYIIIIDAWSHMSYPGVMSYVQMLFDISFMHVVTSFWKGDDCWDTSFWEGEYRFLVSVEDTYLLLVWDDTL